VKIPTPITFDTTTDIASGIPMDRGSSKGEVFSVSIVVATVVAALRY